MGSCQYVADGCWVVAAHAWSREALQKSCWTDLVRHHACPRRYLCILFLTKHEQQQQQKEKEHQGMEALEAVMLWRERRSLGIP